VHDLAFSSRSLSAGLPIPGGSILPQMVDTHIMVTFTGGNPLPFSKGKKKQASWPGEPVQEVWVEN
jgi:hypothetical protein